MSDRPFLDCPNCGEELIPAHSRGRYDQDGNYIEHRDECRCRWCQWMWFDDTEPVTCKCGTTSKVDCDGRVAYAQEIPYNP